MATRISVERGTKPLRPDQLDALRAAVGDADAVVVEQGLTPGGATFHVTQRLEALLPFHTGADATDAADDARTAGCRPLADAPAGFLDGTCPIVRADRFAFLVDVDTCRLALGQARPDGSTAFDTLVEIPSETVAAMECALTRAGVMLDAVHLGLADRRSSYTRDIDRLRDLIRAIDREMAPSDLGQVERDGLTLVFAEPRAEKDSYGMWLAEAARVPFHGPMQTPEDAARVAGAGPGVASLHARDTTNARVRFRALLDRAVADQGVRVQLAEGHVEAARELLAGIEAGTSRIGTLVVPGSRAAATPAARP